MPASLLTVRAHRATATGLGCLLAAALALAGCGGAEPTGAPAAHPLTTAAKTASTATVADPPAAPAGAPGTPGTTHEVADPEEAKSFPAQGVIHHKAATTPARAGEFVPAEGAASNAEVQAELNQMHAVQRSAQKTEAQLGTPVAGGESIGGDGELPIPSGVPEVVRRVVAGANAIADFPYVFGGGHASFVDNAYDCSGSVSYALAAGGLLSAPETSGTLESWGVPGPGRYITVFANAGHTYMYVDGVLFDTAGRSGPYASRWQVSAVDNSGFVERHYPGL
jgi:cell wall-associated NlpC family hydrolase